MLSYSGDGSTKAFGYDFEIDDADDLIVVVVTDATGAYVVKTRTTDYTVSGVGDSAGPTVTFVTAPASGETVELWPWESAIQDVDYTALGKLRNETVETSLDDITRLIQQGRIAQELTAFNRSKMEAMGLVSGFTNAWDAETRRIRNGVSAELGTDYAIKNDVVNLIAAGVVSSGTWTHGHLEMTTSTGTSTSSGVPIKVASTLTTLGSNASEVDMPANNRLRFTGNVAKIFRATAHGTIDMASADVNVKVGIYKNDVLVGTATEFDYENSGKKNDFNCVADGFSMSNGDYVELWVETDSNETVNVTKLTLSLDAIEQQGFTAADADLPDPASLADNTHLVVTSNAWVSKSDGILFDLLGLSSLAKGDVLAYDGTNWVRKAAGSDGKFLKYDSTAASGLSESLPTTSKTVVAGHLHGLTMSNGTDASHDIDIATGECSNFAGDTLVELETAITKQIDATWAEGDDAGGMFTGAVGNDTTYHVIIITKDTDGTVDAGFDTSATGANAPTGWTAVRRIGSVVTDSSANILAFKQYGDTFLWDLPLNDVSDTNPGTSEVTDVVTVPTGIEVGALLSVTHLDETCSSDSHGRVYPAALTDQTVNSATRTTFLNANGGAGQAATVDVEVFTDTSAQISYKVSATAADITLEISTRGWVDRRGRDS